MIPFWFSFWRVFAIWPICGWQFWWCCHCVRHGSRPCMFCHYVLHTYVIYVDADTTVFLFLRIHSFLGQPPWPRSVKKWMNYISFRPADRQLSIDWISTPWGLNGKTTLLEHSEVQWSTANLIKNFDKIFFIILKISWIILKVIFYWKHCKKSGNLW